MGAQLRHREAPPPKQSRLWLTRPTDPNFIAALTTAGIVLHLLLRFVFHASRAIEQAPLVVILLAGGIPLVVPLLRKAFAREFGSDHLEIGRASCRERV